MHMSFQVEIIILKLIHAHSVRGLEERFIVK